MLYNKDRLDAAYAKVGLIADTAWQTDDSDSYVRANQELWSRECALKVRSEKIGMPRSVLDTIPQSRLAEYGTYVYDEKRECVYEPPSNYSPTSSQQNPSNDFTTTYLNQEFRNEDLFQSQEVENLFNVLSDTNAKSSELEDRCNEYLKDLEMKQVDPEYFTVSRNESFSKLSESSSTTESDSEVAYETVKIRKEKIRQPPPRGTATNFSEVILQMQLHSEDVRSLWASNANSQHSLNANVPEFYPSYCQQSKDYEEQSLNYEMVPNVQPWLNYGYPLRHSDFHELDSLVSDVNSLQIPDLSSPRSVPQHAPPPPSPCSTPLITREEPVRRLYSAVLQSPASTSIASAVAATTISVDELDELEREAIEQYTPSSENLAKASEDSIVTAKFQELERLALEQYSESATEINNAGGSGNGSNPLHESLCGGKPHPYAALLLVNSVLVGFYRSVAGTRLLSCLGYGSGGRFR